MQLTGLAMAVAVAAFLSVAGPASAEKVLMFVDFVEDGVDAQHGLNRLYSLKLSSDTRFLYAASVDNNWCSVYSVDPDTRHLTQIQAFQANMTSSPETPTAPVHILMSPGEEFVYIFAYIGASVFVYERDADTGLLTEVQQVTDFNTLWAGAYADMTADGRHIYVALYGGGDGVTVLDRDETSGHVTVKQTVRASDLPVTGLVEAIYPALSPDERFLYVGAYGDDTITIFSRDDDTGLLTYSDVVSNGINGVQNMDGPRWIDISSDGSFLYITALDGHGIVTFERDENTGALTYLDSFVDPVDFNTARVISFTPDENYLFSNGYFGNTVFQFLRDPVTGLLMVDKTYQDGFEPGARGFNTVREIEFTPDGKFVFTASYVEDDEGGGIGIYRFEEPPTAAELWQIY